EHDGNRGKGKHYEHPEPSPVAEQLSAGMPGAVGAVEDHQGGPYQDPWQKVTEGGKLQHELVGGEECRTDEMLLREIAAGHQDRTAAPFEESGDLVFVELVSQQRLLLFNLQAEVFGELLNDVAPSALGQPELHSLEVAVDKVRIFHCLNSS